MAGEVNNYIKYISEGDKDEKLSPRAYLNMIRLDLRDLINRHKPIERLNINNNTDNNNNTNNTNNNDTDNNNNNIIIIIIIITIIIIIIIKILIMENRKLC